jgi:hypothetical protein
MYSRPSSQYHFSPILISWDTPYNPVLRNQNLNQNQKDGSVSFNN